MGARDSVPPSWMAIRTRAFLTDPSPGGRVPSGLLVPSHLLAGWPTWVLALRGGLGLGKGSDWKVACPLGDVGVENLTPGPGSVNAMGGLS